ncbi:GNAT family N-acetyltransferase [Limoniibacter endophyticus]|uniref:N-acetyltransferase n=1 Tax=Limoniibacter endophyticus TaxID=1565040 RepID=A0A8J3DQ82_9HYPH|nr:GNAT family N-acetyltransferase [Limoniibacter endophyticus]GHC73190.1 N-acetyltransferase [Limoniibacter endophyticus]
MQTSVRLQSFELSSRDIADVDVGLLHALSIGVGWPHRAHDWDMLREAGKGIVAVDGIGRVFGTAMWFPHGETFATIGMVITSPRTQAQGNGRWLMEQIMERCGDRDLALNATRPAVNLYLSLGFNTEATVFQCQGDAANEIPLAPAIEGEVVPLAHADFDAVEALDGRAFGAGRVRTLMILAREASILGIRRNGRIEAYAFCRKFGRGHVIGPIVASNDADAINLVAAHLKTLKGAFARVDTRENNGAFVTFLQACGLSVFDTVTTMSKGRPFLNRKTDEPWVYGLSVQALS